MKLYRDLNIGQDSAWHMLHKIRASLLPELPQAFEDFVEINEAYLGGFEKNKHEDKKLNVWHETVGKTIVLDIKDRKTNKIKAKVIEDTTKPSFQEFVDEARTEDSHIFTNEHTSYGGLTNTTPVNHSQKQWAVSTILGELAYTNGIESFWAVFKHTYHGIYHQLSKNHFNRYVPQLAGKHNLRDWDTVDQMAEVAKGMKGKQLKYKDLMK